MNGLIFLGTSHIDPDGYDHLYAALAGHRPEVVLVEVSRASVILRKTLGAMYKKILRHNLSRLHIDINPEISAVINYLGLPSEYTAARDYCRGTGARLFLVDISLFTLVRFARAHRLISRENLRVLSTVEGDRFGQEKNIARKIFIEGDSAALLFSQNRQEKDPLHRFRERILVRRVRKFCRRFKGRGIVYAGGWEHLIDDDGGKSVYSSIHISKNREIVFI